LDVGCGIGNFLAFAEAQGLEAFGVDIEPAAVEAAKARGLVADVQGNLDQLLTPESVDALTMWDVIEHLFDPEAVMSQALITLRPGGAVLLETPDARFWMRRVILWLRTLSLGTVDFVDYMYYWEHKIYFTERGLARLLDRLGCQVVDVHRRTSPREKMQGIFDEGAKADWHSRALSIVWPLLESVTRRTAKGNKLMVIAVSQTRAG
jgi:SAM-dependent methyltransferase